MSRRTRTVSTVASVGHLVQNYPVFKKEGLETWAAMNHKWDVALALIEVARIPSLRFEVFAIDEISYQCDS